MSEAFAMNQPPPVPPTADFKDRHGGLIGFGILVIIIGCLCALFVPLMILGQTMSARTTGTASGLRTMLPAVMMYAALAVVFIWLGIGSTMARRWARALLLILAWVWLLTGVFMEFVMAVFLPKVFAHMPSGGQPMPDAAKVVAIIFALGFTAVMFVILPGLLVLFYRSPHVKATCETRDPVTRWTDACPLPVLALSLFLAYGALWMVVMLFVYHAVMPFFGCLLSGLPGGILILAIIALWVYCAWAIYHLKAAGWWIALIAFGAILVSAVLTFARIDLMDMYRLMGYPEQQIEQLQRFTYFTGRNMLVLMSMSSLPFLGFLLYVKKYFRRTA
jgi:MFS family permease